MVAAYAKESFSRCWMKQRSRNPVSRPKLMCSSRLVCRCALRTSTHRSQCTHWTPPPTGTVSAIPTRNNNRESSPSLIFWNIRIAESSPCLRARTICTPDWLIDWLFRYALRRPLGLICGALLSANVYLVYMFHQVGNRQFGRNFTTILREKQYIPVTLSLGSIL